VGQLNYRAIDVRFQGSICFLSFARREAGNSIDRQLVLECSDALATCDERATVVVVSGSPEVFCVGADFSSVAHEKDAGARREDAQRMYDVWLKMATGPYVTVTHVLGKANAGALGFVAASDIVLAGNSAIFSLSEMLFGLYPACVLPFLIRRVGYQRANYLTLMTQPFSAARACDWGLVDAVDTDAEGLLRRHLLRLRRLSKAAIARYKSYMSRISPLLSDARSAAVAGNVEIFSDQENVELIRRYVDQGVFPWENPG
jgi:polyketide biosynthesis enoyl-CoA hydratase PksH